MDTVTLVTPTLQLTNRHISKIMQVYALTSSHGKEEILHYPRPSFNQKNSLQIHKMRFQLAKRAKGYNEDQVVEN